MTPRTLWETARLTARPASRADAGPVFSEYACDPRVPTYMTWTPHRVVEETAGFLDRCERAWSDGSGYAWTLWSKSDQAFVGILEIRVKGNAAELGYGMGTRWWGQGLMAEALRPVISWALSQPSIYRVWATCDVENTRSARVLERVGMQREGVLRRWLASPNIGDEPRDCYCYSIVR